MVLIIGCDDGKAMDSDGRKRDQCRVQSERSVKLMACLKSQRRESEKN